MKRVVLVGCLALQGCFSLPKLPQPSTPAPELVPCAEVALAECDTKNPETPATAAEISADFAMDLATFFKTQRNECAALNRAKLDCLGRLKVKPR